MENWKAFDSFETTFSDGLNFFVGRNATGKTSLLEGISLGLVGETLTVEDPKVLVRAPTESPARIVLEFLKGSRKYRVERTLSAQRLISSELYCNDDLVAENWNNVTEYLMRLLGVTRNSFERILYLSEGDVFRFIRSPAKKGISQEIEEALGIDRLEELLGELQQEQRIYRDKQNTLVFEKRRLRQIIPITKEKYVALMQEREDKSERIRNLRESLARVDAEIWKCQSQIDKANVAVSTTGQLQRNFCSLIDSSRFDRDFFAEIGNVRDNLQSECDSVQELTYAWLKRKGMLEEQQQSVGQILRLLENVEKDPSRPMFCPVCHKQLSLEERTKLQDEDDRKLHAVRHELGDLTRSIEEKKDLLKKLSETLRELQSSEAYLRDAFTQLEIAQPNRRIADEYLKHKGESVRNLEAEKHGLKDKIFNLETGEHELAQQIAKFQTVDELERSTDLDNSLLSTTKALMILDLLHSASMETVKCQRENRMGPVYTEIENVWRELRKDRQSTVRFDDSTTPIVFRSGQKFEMQQLSGGEKMALFVIVRTVLCRKFTDAGFMLLDEPLEHLDSQNRQSIVDFLVESFEKGWIDQLFVTTFEESIVRKFSDHAHISIVAL